MTNVVQFHQLSIYTGSNSADLVTFLDGTGDPGTTWHVGSESGGTVVLQNKLSGVLQFEITLSVGDGVSRYRGTSQELVAGPWPAASLVSAFMEVPTVAEFQALESRVTALEGP